MPATEPPDAGAAGPAAESLDWMADCADPEGDAMPGGEHDRSRSSRSAGHRGSASRASSDSYGADGRQVLWRSESSSGPGTRPGAAAQSAEQGSESEAPHSSQAQPATVPAQAAAPTTPAEAAATAGAHEQSTSERAARAAAPVSRAAAPQAAATRVAPPAPAATTRAAATAAAPTVPSAAPVAGNGGPAAPPAAAGAGNGGPAAPPAAAPQGYRMMPSVTPQQPSNFALGLGRMAPAPPNADVPVAAPSAQPAAVPLGLGRELPQMTPAAPVQVSQPTAGEEAYKRASTEQKAEENDISLPEVLDVVINAKASDLHLTSGSKPTIRVNGSLKRLEEFPMLDPGMIQRTMYGAITQTQRERFEEVLELDFSYSLVGRGRFRVNMYKQKDSIGAAFRLIPYEIKSLEALGIPASVREFANLPRGFVLVTGPTGSGKSTTLASLIDHANTTRKDHIMTVEDPIEFLHQHKSCLVNQREVGSDTNSFNNALKHVLRQDPDIILVGEMRDLETISVALTAAETGHLVFATLHTQDAAQTIDRVIDVFPPHQQQQVRQQLAGSLQGVVCQTLCKTFDGRGRVVATEILIVTPAVRNLIREGKTHQVYSAMQAGAKHGMHTLDQHLAQLVRSGKISYEVGLEKCHHLIDYNKLCGRG